MDKVLIVGCKKAMDDVCIACSRCHVAFNRKEGHFEIYEDSDAEILGILSCGDCPGAAIVTRLVQVSMWNKPMNENVTKVHIAPCIVEHCPYKETIIAKIKAKAGVQVIEGTHEYKPSNIFA